MAVVEEVDKIMPGRNFCVTGGGPVGWVSPLAKSEIRSVFRGTTYPFCDTKSWERERYDISASWG
jgi:hypothetical protein